MRRASWILILVLAACDGAKPPKIDAPAKVEAKQDTPPNVEVAFTRCESDDECLISCVEADSCCTKQCSCTNARHGKDDQAILAKRRDCTGFAYETCPQESCAEQQQFVWLPKCKEHRCVAEKIKREAPPPPIDLGGWSLACTTDADCVVVETSPCTKCGCASTPLAKSEQDRFTEARTQVKCPPYDTQPNIRCGDCREREPYCNAGQCAVR